MTETRGTLDIEGATDTPKTRHPDSIFTAAEQERMRQYGAIFDEKDREVWEAAVAEARSGLEES